jgi:hypothetical protein
MAACSAATRVSDVTIHEHGCAGGNVPKQHGTAVASLLVGHGEHFSGRGGGAELYSADVYCGLGTGGAVDAVAEAFAWMSRERCRSSTSASSVRRTVLLEQ